MAIFCAHSEATTMRGGDLELFFNFNLEFLNNRWANPAQTRAQSAPSLPPRERATAKRCDNKKEVGASFFFSEIWLFNEGQGGLAENRLSVAPPHPLAELRINASSPPSEIPSR